MSETPTLSTARTIPDILEACARWCWYEDHDGADCPADQIPSVQSHSAWLADEPDLVAATKERVLELVHVAHAVPADTEGWDDLSRALLDVAVRLMGPMLPPVMPEKPGQYVAAMDGEEIAGLVRLQDDLSGSVHVGDVHRLWRLLPDPSPEELPLIPLVRAWQKRPTPTEPDRRTTGILPKESGKLLRPKTGWLPGLAAASGSRPELGLVQGPRQLQFGFMPDFGELKQPALIQLYDEAGGLSGKQRGIAPPSMRIFIEGLCALNTDFRNGTERQITISVQEVAGEWLQWKLKGWYWSNHGERLERALNEIHGMAITVNDKGGWYRPMAIRALSEKSLNGKIVFDAMLPASGKVGAQVNRSVLRVLGKLSEPAYRLYLSLCFEWERKVMRHGKLIRPTLPVVERDEQGVVLDGHGRRVVGWGRIAVRSPYDRRAIRTGEREPNPARTRYPEYDVAQLLAMAHAPSVLARDKTPASRRKRKQRTLKALRLIEKAGGCKTEETVRGRAWRIMSPDPPKPNT